MGVHSGRSMSELAESESIAPRRWLTGSRGGAMGFFIVALEAIAGAEPRPRAGIDRARDHAADDTAGWTAARARRLAPARPVELGLDLAIDRVPTRLTNTTARRASATSRARRSRR